MAEQMSLEVFRALADPTRLKILELLRTGKELCVSSIAEHFKMTQPSISHHLNVLGRARLVEREKRGREVYYRFNREAILDCCGNQFRLFDLEIRLCKGARRGALMVKKRSPER